MRTQREIVAQCEERMAAIEAEAREKQDRTLPNPERPFCTTCKWSTGAGCAEPLVKGLGHAPRNWDSHRWPSSAITSPSALCGVEKALWIARPPVRWWQTQTATLAMAIGAAFALPGIAGLFFGVPGAVMVFLAELIGVCLLVGNW